MNEQEVASTLWAFGRHMRCGGWEDKPREVLGACHVRKTFRSCRGLRHVRTTKVKGKSGHCPSHLKEGSTVSGRPLWVLEA